MHAARVSVLTLAGVATSMVIGAVIARRSPPPIERVIDHELAGDCDDADLARLQQADPEVWGCLPGWIGDRRVAFAISGHGETRCIEQSIGDHRTLLALSHPAEVHHLSVVDRDLVTIAPRVEFPGSHQPAFPTPRAVDLDGDGTDELVLQRETDSGFAVRVVALRGGWLAASAEEHSTRSLPREEDVDLLERPGVETLEDVGRRLLRGPLVPLR